MRDTTIMALKEKLSDDLKQALRRGDKTKVSTIRLVLAGITNDEIAQQVSLDDNGAISVIKREARQHRESIEAFHQANRPDLVAKEEAELAVLLGYLPEQISTEELATLAKQVIEEVGAKGPADKGKVMAKLMAQVKGKADGKEANALVSQLLSQI
jgi:hypothetical protein